MVRRSAICKIAVRAAVGERAAPGWATGADPKRRVAPRGPEGVSVRRAPGERVRPLVGTGGRTSGRQRVGIAGEVVDALDRFGHAPLVPAGSAAEIADHRLGRRRRLRRSRRWPRSSDRAARPGRGLRVRRGTTASGGGCGTASAAPGTARLLDTRPVQDMSRVPHAGFIAATRWRRGAERLTVGSRPTHLPRQCISSEQCMSSVRPTHQMICATRPATARYHGRLMEPLSRLADGRPRRLPRPRPGALQRVPAARVIARPDARQTLERAARSVERAAGAAGASGCPRRRRHRRPQLRRAAGAARAARTAGALLRRPAGAARRRRQLQPGADARRDRLCPAHRHRRRRAALEP